MSVNVRLQIRLQCWDVSVLWEQLHYSIGQMRASSPIFYTPSLRQRVSRVARAHCVSQYSFHHIQNASLSDVFWEKSKRWSWTWIIYAAERRETPPCIIQMSIKSPGKTINVSQLSAKEHYYYTNHTNF